MIRRMLTICMALSTLAIATAAVAADAPPWRVTQIAIVTGHASTGPELKAADMLKSRILKRSDIHADIVAENASDIDKQMAGAEAVMVVGMPEGNDLSAKLVGDFHVHRPTLPNTDTLHPEGFAVKSGTVDGRHYVVIAGSDERGTIYGVGCLLRAMTYLEKAVVIPPMDVADNPCFALRGGRPTGPGSRARQYGNLRPQTGAEHQEVMEDLMLLGTNVFEGDPKYVHTYGMMTMIGRTANQLDGGFPKEWGADDGRSTRYVCPSVPEARKALLDSFDKMFRSMPDYDFFTTNSGDDGGCRDARCMPWGATYIRLVHEIADILHKYHPNTKVLATNQDLTAEGDQAIFDYLNKGDSSWLYAIRYGPGADQMQTYIRGPVTPKFFKYEGFGPLSNYLATIDHELPRTTNIVLYSDITHWMQSQFGVPHPDVALAAVYDRRSWNARPRTFYKVGRQILHYALGDMHYSEGMHDDFNKWFWYRMLWNPNQSAEDITHDYCRYWFGPDAANGMTQAIFVMEKNLEKPVLGNEGISDAVNLVRTAGKHIPSNLMKDDYRWRIIFQKALMDRYIQFELMHGLEMTIQARQILKEGTDAAHVEEAVKALNQPIETDPMKVIIAEAKQLGEESNQIIGYRVVAPVIVPKLDLSEVQWCAKTLQDALDTKDDAKIQNAVKMVFDYDDPGEGGFYDNLGWPNDSKHLIHGEALWGFMPFPGPAKQSQYDLAYSRSPKGPGVTFAYDHLDPEAQYVVRISVGAHFDEEDAPQFKNAKLAEGMKADDAVLSDGFPVPVGGVAYHEFEIPKSATADGKVQIELTRVPGAFPITAAYEIWLMRKDKMPWTAQP